MTPRADSSHDPSSASSLDLSGTELGDYQLIRRLGRGGMAEVYLAQQKSLSRSVALKLLQPRLASDHNYVRRFHNEARAAAALVHPNIVQIFEVGQHAGQHFIAQEYVAGKTVKHLLEKEGSLPAGLSVTILRQIVAALHKAAQLGIVHRDIKPENVLLDDLGVAKVADFGLAKQASSDELGLTTTGMAMGTPSYMSPEQVQGHSVDCRSDIYALGITAYQMLSGRLPYEGDTPMSVALKQVNAPVPDVAVVASDVPPPLCAAVAKMMAKQPAARFQTPAELARELQTISDAIGGTRGLSVAATVAITEAENSAGVGGFGATQHLADVLRTAAERPAGVPARTWATWAAAALVGALLARAWIPTDPLSSTSPAPSVPRKDSPRAQYLYASLVNTKESWQGVLEYFPADGEAERQRYYALRAKVQLGRWYLENGDPTNATELFGELAELNSTEREFRALGIAGLALCCEATGDLARAADHLTDAMELADELDPTTRERLNRLHERLRAAAREN